MKTLLGFLLIVGLVAGGIGSWYWEFGGRRPVEFRTVPVERGTLKIAVSATGTLEPEEVVDVGAQVIGRIKSFGPDETSPTGRIDYNSKVKQGAVLAEIDDALYQAALQQSQANLKRAESEILRHNAKLLQAEQDFKRAKELGPDIPRAEFDKYVAAFEGAKAELKIAEAGLDQAKAGLHEAEINLGYVTIRAPIDGVVLHRRVNVGQTVVSGLNAPSLFLLAKDLSRMQVVASVNEADIGKIHVDQPVTFTVDAHPGETFAGKVLQIRLNANMTHNVVTYGVIVTTENPDDKLLPSMTANMQFAVAERKDVLLVPNQALRWRPTSAQVVPESRDKLAQLESMVDDGSLGDEQGSKGVLWVEAGEGLLRPIDVEIGLSDGVLSELVNAKLKDGDAIVVGEQRESAGNFGPAFLPKRQSNQESGN